jgi:hypothetical protein
MTEGRKPPSQAVEPVPIEITLADKTRLRNRFISLLHNAQPINYRYKSDLPDTWHSTYQKGARTIELFFTPNLIPVTSFNLEEELARAQAGRGEPQFTVRIRRNVGVTNHGGDTVPVVEERLATLTSYFGVRESGKPLEPSYTYGEDKSVYDQQGNFLEPYNGDFPRDAVDKAISLFETGSSLRRTFAQTRERRRFEDIMTVLDSLNPEDECRPAHDPVRS